MKFGNGSVELQSVEVVFRMMLIEFPCFLLSPALSKGEGVHEEYNSYGVAAGVLFFLALIFLTTLEKLNCCCNGALPL